MAGVTKCIQWGAMVILLGSIPMFTPLEVPTIPEPLVETENRSENWWYEDTRSDWVVLEDCWSNDQVHHQWWALEISIRSMLDNAPVSRLISSDLDWTYDGFCIRLQGLQNDVLSQRQIYADTLIHADIENPPREILTLDRRHFNWIYNELDIPMMMRQKRIWRHFWEEASLRTVYSSSLPLPLEPWPSSQKSWFPRMYLGQEEQDVFIQYCNTQIRPEFPQVAVSIEAMYPELSSAEMRIVAMILGDGVRSRLSQKLREEMGVVYSIGARFTGDAIQIDFTVDPTQLVDSLKAVRIVLLEFSQNGPSQMELDTARSMFLLRQYELLEDRASFIRMAGRFPTPQGWATYIERTVDVFETDRWGDLMMGYPYLYVWMTGPLNHPEMFTTDVSQMQGVCSVLQVDRH